MFSLVVDTVIIHLAHVSEHLVGPFSGDYVVLYSQHH